MVWGEGRKKSSSGKGLLDQDNLSVLLTKSSDRGC